MRNTFLQTTKKNVCRQIELIDITPRYLVINKPSGIQCNGTKNYSNYVLPQLYKELKERFSASNPNFKLNPNQYKIVHRLDKYVSGGLIIARGKNANAFTKAFSRKDSPVSVKRRYVGLLPVPDTTSFQEYLQRLPNLMVKSGDKVKYLNSPAKCPSDKGIIFSNDQLDEGIINFDIEASLKDDRKQKTDKRFVQYDALTKFKILHSNFHIPTSKQKSEFPSLFNDKVIYPIIIELETGRKNQIRDHILQAFNISLLNDDKFSKFKRGFQFKGVNINSEVYATNQIGLHSAYLSILRNSQLNEYLLPILTADKYLWDGFINGNAFIQSIEDELRNF